MVSQVTSQPGVPSVPVAPTPAQALVNKIHNIFRVLSQENIDESFLSQIHELEAGWKQQFLEAYKEDDLLGCASLLEQAVEGCVEEAKGFVKTRQGPQDFFKAFSKIGENEKTALVSCFSKEEQPGLSKGMQIFEAARALPAVASLQQAVTAAWSARNLPFVSIGGRLIGAALNIDMLAHTPHVMGLIHEAYNGDKWPLIVGGIAGLSTAAVCIGTGQFYAAPKAGLTAMNVASEATRGARKVYKQWKLKKNREKISTRFHQVTIGTKRKLRPIDKELEGKPAPKRRKLSTTFNPIFKYLAPREGIDLFKKKFNTETSPEVPQKAPPPPTEEPQGAEAAKETPQEEIPSEEPPTPMEEDESLERKRHHRDISTPEEIVEKTKSKKKSAETPATPPRKRKKVT